MKILKNKTYRELTTQLDLMKSSLGEINRRYDFMVQERRQLESKIDEKDRTISELSVKAAKWDKEANRQREKSKRAAKKKKAEKIKKTEAQQFAEYNLGEIISTEEFGKGYVCGYNKGENDYIIVGFDNRDDGAWRGVEKSDVILKKHDSYCFEKVSYCHKQLFSAKEFSKANLGAEITIGNEGLKGNICGYNDVNNWVILGLGNDYGYYGYTPEFEQTVIIEKYDSYIDCTLEAVKQQLRKQ